MSGLLALLDDVAAIAKVAAASVDDIAGAAAKAGAKAAGVVIDDAAVTPKYVHGFEAARELPIIWRIARGSLFNKLVILLPAALVLSYFLPQAITPLLMLGGAYLCFEGFEKLAHKYLHSAEDLAADQAALSQAALDPQQDLLAFEADKVRGAIRTDFILSAEIIAITLGTVSAAAFGTQVLVLSGIALLMTVGVYGLVAGIVKLDDAGLYLSRREGSLSQRFGRLLLVAAPWLMKALAVAGTAAMFLVGGGILAHGLPFLHELPAQLAQGLGPLGGVAGLLSSGLVGVVAGALVLAGVTLAQRLRGAFAKG